MRIWKWAGWTWTAIGNLWLARDLAIWVGLPTVAAAVIAPLLIRALTPLSFADTAFVSVAFGVVAFSLAAYFAPKVLHIHHLPLAGQSRVSANLQMNVTGPPLSLLMSEKVPIWEAARLGYEAAERAGILDLVSSPGVPPRGKLAHFVFVFLTDDDTTLYGVKPPSTQSMPISQSAKTNLVPVEGESKLRYLTASSGVGYDDVTIPRGDLTRVIAKYVTRVSGLADKKI